MDEIKEYCCQIKTPTQETRIYYFDTNDDAQNKMLELQVIPIQDVNIFAGRTENKDRKRTTPVVLQEEIEELIEELVCQPVV